MALLLSGGFNSQPTAATVVETHKQTVCFCLLSFGAPVEPAATLPPTAQKLSVSASVRVQQQQLKIEAKGEPGTGRRRRVVDTAVVVHC